jgi:hypothetical protein
LDRLICLQKGGDAPLLTPSPPAASENIFKHVTPQVIAALFKIRWVILRDTVVWARQQDVSFE